MEKVQAVGTRAASEHGLQGGDDLFYWDCLDILVELEFVLSGVDDVEPFEIQILHGDVHGFRQFRRTCALEFKAGFFQALYDDQIDFGVRMSCPKEAGIAWRPEPGANLVEGESLPGCPDLGMSL